MRGVAVIAVVLFHARVAGFSGGFVGVDVFFVLSGFLITGILIDERARGHGIALGRFYTRRIRRLMPASILVFIVTIVMVNRWMLPLDAADLRPQAPWVALFGSNIWFSNHATDYLQPEVVSPFQQYWSLAVEEQFYLVWPFLILAFTFRLRDPGRPARRLAIGLGVVVAASFVLAVGLMRVRQPSAFFLLPPRAWELGAGGLLAVYLRARTDRPVSPGVRTSVGFVGMAVVAISVVAYGASTRFPGVTALPPVLGTIAILWAGAPARSGRTQTGDGSGDIREPALNRWLGTTGPRLVGRYSYSLYLWHWPLLVIPEAAAGRPMGPWERVGLVAIAVVLSIITFHLVENPLRYLPFLAASKTWSLLLGVALVSAALAMTTTLPQPGESTVVEEHLADVLPPDLAAAVAAAPNDRGAASDRGCQHGLGSDVATKPIDPGPCMFGSVDDASAPLVMLVGDSHATSWHPALEKIVDESHWRLLTLTKSSCPLVPVPVHNEQTEAHYTDCDNWRVVIAGIIDEMKPDLIVLAQMSNYYANDPTQVGQTAWLAAMGEIVTQLSSRTPVIVLQDVPKAPWSIPTCILRSEGQLDTCEFEQSDQELALSDAERAVVQQSGGTYVDTVPMVCPDGRCVAARGDIVTYTDRSHMTAPFSESLATQLRPMIEAHVAE